MSLRKDGKVDRRYPTRDELPFVRARLKAKAEFVNNLILRDLDPIPFICTNCGRVATIERIIALKVKQLTCKKCGYYMVPA